MIDNILSRDEILDYEVRASWWAGFISHPFLQDLSARYYARKVKRKYKRYLRVKKFEQLIRKFNNP